MFTIPENLADLCAEQLYQLLDDLAEYRRRHGKGHTEAAVQVRAYCKQERPRLKAELKRRDLSGTRPGDDRVYGPGTATWQQAGAHVQ